MTRGPLFLGRRSALGQLALGLAASLSGCKGVASPARSAGFSRIVDLTHTLSPSFPFIPVENKTFPFRMSPIATVAADGVYANRWELTEHVGTHLDAPCHFRAGAVAVDEIPLLDLVAPLAVISIAARVRTDADALLDIGDLDRWEREHGRLVEGSAVFLHTGWEPRADTQERFINADAAGAMHFPGFSAAVVEHLVARRSIRGIGIDTLSIDPGRERAYPVHKRLFAEGKWAVECLARLTEVPPAGATVVVAPVKVRGASGAPARVLAMW